MNNDKSVVPRSVEDEVKESYLRYSMSVIIARALPDARDGLKPSQRRILYAMLKLNLAPNAKFRKCAKIAGDTSGDYHPHGEAVIYPTLVRLARDWVMRYPLILGQGNFGSIDGDPPAQMRYTEAKLTAAAVAMMDDLEKRTVDLVSNYDETKKEPVVFPSTFPNLLCNGSSGIAVGMATNLPPHNFQELSRAVKFVLHNPGASFEEIIELLPGPDFPTGGVICGYRGIQQAYRTGRGKLIVRAKIVVEEMGPERFFLRIDEIPYGVNKSNLLQEIAELINDKKIVGISDLRDESDRDGLRIIIELKKQQPAEIILNQLYKFSALQVTFGCNFLALDKGLPRLMNIRQLIQVWIDHRIEVIQRRTRFELEKALLRAHILEGYLKAVNALDQVVRWIRESKDRIEAKLRLLGELDFSDKQVEAILELRLYQLTGLEIDKITKELGELLERIDHYRKLLASDLLIREVIEEELTQLEKKHSSPRRTEIVPLEDEVDMEDLIPNEEVAITISEDDYVKRMSIDTFRQQKRGGQGVSGIGMKREDDALKGLYIAMSHDTLLVFTTLGRCYWLKAWQIPESGRKAKGRPLVNLLEDLKPDEKIATVLKVSSFDEECSIAMATKLGVIKKCLLEEFSNPRRKGIVALQIAEGDFLIAARLVQKGDQIMLFTRGGMAVRFEEDCVRPMGRNARGVRGVQLKDDQDAVVALEAVQGNEAILIACENGFGKRSQVADFRLTNRGAMGVRSILANERNGAVVGAFCAQDNDQLLMMSASGQAVRIRLGEVRIMGRSTQGVKLANLKEGDHLVAIQKLRLIEEEANESL